MSRIEIFKLENGNRAVEKSKAIQINLNNNTPIKLTRFNIKQLINKNNSEIIAKESMV